LPFTAGERLSVPDVGLDGDDKRFDLAAREQKSPDLAPAQPSGRFDAMYPVDHFHRPLVHHNRREPVEHLGERQHMVLVHLHSPRGIAPRKVC
jgi:hypothetical protein